MIKEFNLTKFLMGLCAIMVFMVLASQLNADEDMPGFIDIDLPDVGEPKVEVNLTGALFSLAANMLGNEEPETSEFLANLKAVRVRIYDRVSLGDKTLEQASEYYTKQLKKAKWEIMAKIREKDANIGIYSLMKDDTMTGIVVLVGKPQQFTVVNLVGEIDITKLAQLREITGIELDIPEIDMKKRKDIPERKERQRSQKQDEAIQSFLNDDSSRAIALLEELDEAGMSNEMDYALMAFIYNTRGEIDKSYKSLAKLYEFRDFHDISSELYEKAEKTSFDKPEFSKQAKKTSKININT
ncbi:DUF4252 domain-containing protein, partial [Candidatus Poribacteria bacterium]|nr:DUF4252 domain-containing protein [Candidatus Poribacteria bacterium]